MLKPLSLLLHLILIPAVCLIAQAGSVPSTVFTQPMTWHLENETGKEILEEEILTQETTDNGKTLIRFRITSPQGWFQAEGLRTLHRHEDQQLSVQVQLEAPETWTQPLRGLSLHIPLDLQWRKRVFFQGDYGLQWDTRYFYQFHLDTLGRILTEPERNEWRHFSLHYLTPDQGILQKAESRRTPFLKMQESAAIPPFVQIYDEQGGYSLFFENLENYSPSGFQVDASGEGKVEWEWWSPAFPEVYPGSSESVPLFEAPRTVHLFYDQGQGALRTRREQVLSPWVFSAHPDSDVGLQEQSWVTAAETVDLEYVRGGWPLRQGELSPQQTVLIKTGGQPVPSQTRPLAFWPDGSVKWLSVVAAIQKQDQETATGEAEISWRTGERIPFSVEIASSEKAPVSPHQIQIQREQQRVTIDTGELTVELDHGIHWLKSIRQHGEELLDTDHPAGLFYAQYRLGGELESGSRLIRGGVTDHAELIVEQIELLDQGPLRAELMLKGTIPNQEPTPITLYLTFYAGLPLIDVQANVEFRFDDPRQTFLTGLGLDLRLREKDPYAMCFAGQTLAQPNRIGRLLQLTPLSGWLQSEVSPSEFLQRSPGWAAFSNDQRTIGVALRNFWQQAPSSITFSEPESLLRLELWPEAAGPMDVRRYSEYPHRSQGEGTSAQNKWVEETYYPQHPFHGISRTREFRLMFLPADSVSLAEGYAADLESRPLLYAGWERYRDSGTSLQAPDKDTWPSAWEGWTRLAKFWLYHQHLHGWHGFWEYGDIQHQYRRGYGWILSLPQLAEELAKPPSQRQAFRSSTHRIVDYFPNNDWAFDNGRWGWTNTEGLPNLFLQNEYMRNGQRQLFFAAEALARYSRDVVTRQSGQWFGAGTRHGVQPWSDGNHEPRQTTLTEWRPHFFLSGGEWRSRHVFDHLFNNAYNKKTYTVHAHHSAVLQGFLFQWELTGNHEDRERLSRYVHHFTSDQGLYIRPSVRFPKITATDAPQDLNSGNMFFHTFGGMHAMLDYYRLTQDPKVRTAFLAMGQSILADKERAQSMKSGTRFEPIWGALVLMAETADDPAPYQDLLRHYTLNRGALMTYQPVTANSEHWSGLTGYLASSIPGIHFWNNWAPDVLSVLDSQELHSEELTLEMQRIEDQGNPRPPAFPSWQSDYDANPIIKKWLEPWWPEGGKH